MPIDDHKTAAVEDGVKAYHAALAPRDTTYNPDEALRHAIEKGINSYTSRLLKGQLEVRR